SRLTDPRENRLTPPRQMPLGIRPEAGCRELLCILVANDRRITLFLADTVIEDGPSRLKRLVDRDANGKCVFQQSAWYILDLRCLSVPSTKMHPIVIIGPEFGGQSGDRDGD